MNSEVFAALDQLEFERNIPKEYMLEKLQQALLKAVKEQMKKDGNPQAAEGAMVELDDKDRDIRIFICRTVVPEDEPEEDDVDDSDELDHYITEEELAAERAAEAAKAEEEAAKAAELAARIEAGEIPPPEPEEPEWKPRRNRAIELSLEEARAIDPKAEIGDVIREPLETKTFGRIAAQAAKSVVIQAIREAERGLLADNFSAKAHQMLSGQVNKVDPRAGMVFVRVTGMNGTDDELADAVLPPEEQVQGEEYYEGQWIKVYMLQVNRTVKRGPQVIVSRTHAGLVRRLMELEIPEIGEGIVEIRGVAREPGLRSKVAVSSNDPNVDAVGACIGERSSRVDRVVTELRGEKIDIIPYYDEPEKFIAAALAPAEIYSVVVEPGVKKCRVVAPDNQLSLAIGKEGKNAKLAAKLTGYKIDIRPSSEAVDYSSLNSEQLQQLSSLLEAPVNTEG
ncbi:MAG: transcription termination factor NusA [Oscillospiraceae bacterium]|jgi:N utilization substance protein A|nr:transcription termination factor NusA [Oscillospiraceae bacterium]